MCVCVRVHIDACRSRAVGILGVGTQSPLIRVGILHHELRTYIRVEIPRSGLHRRTAAKEYLCQGGTGLRIEAV